jgi:hypothetical protein
MLEATGFHWLTPDWHHAELPETKLGVIPQCTARPEEALTWIQSAVETEPGTVVVLVTHPFDFTGPDGDAYFNALDALLARVNTSSDWDCIGFTDLPAQRSGDWPRRFASAVAWERAQSILEDSLGAATLWRVEPPIYRPITWYDQHVGKARTAVAAAMLLSTIAGALAAYAIARLLLRSRLRAAAAGLLSAAVVAVLLWGAVAIQHNGYHVRGIRWQVICVAAGATFASGLCAIRAGRREGTVPISSAGGKAISAPTTTSENNKPGEMGTVPLLRGETLLAAHKTGSGST